MIKPRLYLGLLLLAAPFEGSRDLSAQIPVTGPAPEPIQPSSTARELIQRAAAEGKLSEEEGLLHRLYALTGDERLPAAYRGSTSDTLLADGAVIREVAMAFPTLSPAAQAAAAPYFQPPIYPGSWYELREGAAPAASANPTASVREPGPGPLPREGWKTTASLTVPIRVWHREEEPRMGPRAVYIGRLIEKAWPILTGIMGRTPLSDEGSHPHVHVEGPTKGAFDAWGDGGDGRFDVYLVPLPGWRVGGAVTMAYPPGCSQRPAFMLVDSRQDPKSIEAAAVHEFMHAIEFAFKVGSDCGLGWDEASANWALNHVLPSNNFEHYSRSCLLWPGSDCTSYEAWVFALYLERTHGPSVIRRSWELMANLPAWRAVDAAIPGGLKTAWPKFALHGWNQPPYPTYDEWDGFLVKPLSPGYDNDAYFAGLERLRQKFPNEENPVALDHRETAMLPTPVRAELRLDDKLREKVEVLDEVSNRLSRNYVRYSLPDKKVRYLRIKHPYKSGGPVSIQALRKRPDSSWVTEDWTGDAEVTICRNEPDEDLTELVLIFANATPDGKALERIPHVPGTNRWPSTGKATIEMRTICPKSFRVHFVHRVTSEKLGEERSVTMNAVVRELDTPDADGNTFAGRGRYKGSFRKYNPSCDNKLRTDYQTVPLAGQAKGIAAAADYGGGQTGLTFTLAPIKDEGMDLIPVAQSLMLTDGKAQDTRTFTMQSDRCRGTLTHVTEWSVKQIK